MHTLINKHQSDSSYTSWPKVWSMVLELQQSSISIYQDHLVSFLLVGHGMLLQILKYIANKSISITMDEETEVFQSTVTLNNF